MTETKAGNKIWTEELKLKLIETQILNQGIIRRMSQTKEDQIGAECRQCVDRKSLSC